MSDTDGGWCCNCCDGGVELVVVAVADFGIFVSGVGCCVGVVLAVAAVVGFDIFVVTFDVVAVDLSTVGSG